MTDTITTLSLITLAQEYRGDIVKQINRRCSALRVIKIVPGAGKNVAWAPQGDGQLAENYTEGADAANFGADAQTSAVLNWSLYRANIHVSNLALDAAATTGTPEGNRLRWAKEVRDGAEKLASTINKAIFNGVGTGTTMFGLDGAVGNNSNTYATVDRSQTPNAYFRPNVFDPGALTSITFALIRDDLRQIYEQSGETPDVALCSPAVFNSIGNLFDANRRYITDIVTARGSVKLDASLGALELDGTIFLRDKDATANQIYYINTNYMELQYLPPAGQPVDEDAEMMNADDGFGEIMLGMKYEMLAKTGASEKAEIRTTTQLKIDRPNACGVRKNVAA